MYYYLISSVDFVNLISYDFHYYRRDRPYTGHHSPLYPRPIEKGYFVTLNAVRNFHFIQI
jgi:chitinase